MAASNTPPSSPTPRPLWRRIGRWTWRIVGGVLLTVLAIVAVVVLLALWLTQTSSGHAFLVAQAMGIVNEHVLVSEASVGELRGNLFSHVELHDVVLRDASGDTAVRADRIAATWVLSGLFRQHIEVTSLEIEGVSVNARIEEDGGMNLARLVQPSTPKPPDPTATPWTVAVSDITIADTGFALRDARNDNARIVMVRGLEAAGGVTIDADGVIDAGLSRMSAALATPMVEQSALDVALTEVAVRSSSEGLDASVATLEVEGTELSDLGLSVTWSDDQMFEHLEGGFDAIKLSADDLNEAIGQELLAVSVGVAATVEGTPDDLRLILDLSGPGEDIAIALRLDITEPAVPGYRLRADIVRFSPARWLAIDVPEADVSVGVVIDGRGITPDGATGSIRLDIGPSQVMGWGVDGGAVSARYADGTVTVDRLDAWTTGLEVNAAASASLDGDFSIDAGVGVTDLSMLGSWSPIENDVAGRADVRVEAAGSVPLERMSELAGMDPVAAAETLLGDVRVDVSLDGRSLRWDDIEVGDIEFSGSIPPAESLEVRVALDVEDVVVPGAPTITSASLDARYADERVRLSLVAEEAQGRRVRVEAGVEQTDEGARASFSTLELAADRLAIRLVEPMSVDVALDDAFAPIGVETTPIRMAIGSSRFDLEAEWHSDGRVDVSVDSKGVDLADVGDLVAPELGLEGVADFRLGLGNRLQDPVISFGGSLQDLGIGEVRDVDIRGAVEFADERVDAKVNIQYGGIPVLVLDTGSAGIPLEVDLARGTVEPGWERQVAASAKIPRMRVDDLRALQPDLDIPLRGGELAGHLTLDGTPANPLLTLHVELTDVDAVLQPLAPEPAVPDEAGAAPTLGPLDAVIDVGFDGVERNMLELRVSATLDDDPLATIALTTPVDAIGILRGDVDPMAWAEQASADVDARVGPVRLSQLPKSMRDLVPVTQARAELRVDWSGGARDGVALVELIADEVEYRDLPLFGVRVRIDASDDTSVLARFSAGEPQRVQQVLYARDFDAEVERFDQQYGAEVPLDVAAGELVATISQGWRDMLDNGPDASGDVEARLNIAGAPMGLFVEVPRDAPPVTGVLRGYIDVVGSPVAPDVVGRLAVRDIGLGDDQRGTVAAQISFDGREARVDADLCSSGGDTLVLAASAQVDGPLIGSDWMFSPPDLANLPFEVRMFADGAELASVLPRFATSSLVEDVDGTLDIDFEVTGTPAAPRFEGALSVRDGAMGIIPLGRSFEGMEVEMGLASDGVVIERLVIRDGDGRLSGQGRVGLADLRPSDIDLDVDLRDFLIADPSGAGVYVDGDVAIDGTMRGDVLDAEVELTGLTVTVPDTSSASSGGPTSLPEYVYFVGEDVAEGEVGARRPRRIGQEEEAAPNPFLARIHVATRGRNQVEHSLAEVQFTVDLDVDIDANDFRLTGAVELPRGRVTFAGKPFDITRGFITFDGRPSDVDPVVDVRAEHTLSPSVAARLPSPSAGEATVQVIVDGRVSELTNSENESIRLQSDPEMSRQDILFVLLTGRPRDVDADASADQQALATASSLLLGLLGDRLAGDLPIDTLRIEGDTQSGQAIARVEGGKFIAEDLYVAGTYINSQDQEENDFEFAIQWIIARLGSASIRTELRMGNRAKGGIELLYSLTRRGRRRAEPDQASDAAAQQESTMDSQGDGTPNDGTPDDGTPDDGTPDDGTPDDGATPREEDDPPADDIEGDAAPGGG